MTTTSNLATSTEPSVQSDDRVIVEASCTRLCVTQNVTRRGLSALGVEAGREITGRAGR